MLYFINTMHIFIVFLIICISTSFATDDVYIYDGYISNTDDINSNIDVKHIKLYTSALGYTHKATMELRMGELLLKHNHLTY